MTAPFLYVCSMDEDESKGIIMNKTLSHGCSKNKDESKGIIIHKTLLQSCSTDKDKLCFTEEDE